MMFDDPRSPRGEDPADSAAMSVVIILLATFILVMLA